MVDELSHTPPTVGRSLKMNKTLKLTSEMVLELTNIKVLKVTKCD